MATEVIRPNAAGSETSIDSQFPDSGAHWDKVDEVTADTWTYIWSQSTVYQRDLYALPASSGVGDITSVTVYFRVAGFSVGGHGYVKPSLKNGAVVTDGTEVELDLPYEFTTYSQAWTTNPEDAEDWEWADIDAMEVGVSFKIDAFPGTACCTQVWVVVTYTQPPPLTSLTEDLADSFDPLFVSDAAYVDYAITALNAEDSITLTATLADATITYSYGEVEDEEVASGTPKEIDLDVGENVITIKVTHGATPTLTYTITVTRENPAADLTSLTENLAGAFDPAFAAATYEYAIDATFAETSITLTATLTGATITYIYTGEDGKEVASGVGHEIDLAVGVNLIYIQVELADHQTRTYTITVTRSTGIHPFHEKSTKHTLVAPNKWTVSSHPNHEDDYTGNATYSPSYDRLPIEDFRYQRVSSDDEAEDLAQALRDRATRDAETGSSVVPLNPAQEIHDYVQITDSREGNVIRGRVRQFRWYAGRGRYRAWLGFGARSGLKPISLINIEEKTDTEPVSVPNWGRDLQSQSFRSDMMLAEHINALERKVAALEAVSNHVLRGPTVKFSAPTRVLDTDYTNGTTLRLVYACCKCDEPDVGYVVAYTGINTSSYIVTGIGGYMAITTGEAEAAFGVFFAVPPGYKYKVQKVSTVSLLTWSEWDISL